MLKVHEDWISRVGQRHPGFRDTLARWERDVLPACPRCHSPNTAKVSSGVVGLSIHLATATTKIRLLPNGHPADFYCWDCDRYFDSWGQTAAVEGLLVTVDRPCRLLFVVACFVQVENPGTKPVGWDPARLHALLKGTQYETDDVSGIEATCLEPGRRLQDYLSFDLPLEVSDRDIARLKVVYGCVDKPQAVWRG